jgi:4-amino-4-deoxy-L-arabinose transferase-like glycosyltransferase
VSKRKERLLILGVALATRVLAFLAITIFLGATGAGQIFPDEYTYLLGARNVLAGRAAIYEYSEWLAAVFQFTGYQPWIARAVNVIFGAASALLVYELGNRMLGPKVGRYSGLAIALWPSLIVWSAVVLKDSLVFLGIELFLLGAVIAAKKGWWGLLLAGIGSVLIQSTRPWAFAIASIAIGLSLLVELVRSRAQVAAPFLCTVALLGLIGLQGGQGFLGATYVKKQLTLGAIQDSRTGGARGKTVFVPPPESVGDIAQEAPSGIIGNLLGPFPWQPSSVEARVLATVESLVWYPALVLAFMGAWMIGPRRLIRDWMPLLMFLGGICLVLFIFQANAGTAFRQRAMIFPIVIVLASGGLGMIKERSDRISPRNPEPRLR